MVSATVDDVRDRVPHWKIFLDILSYANAIVLFFAYFVQPIAAFFGRGLWVVLAFSVLWGTGRAIEEYRDLPPDPDFTSREETLIKAFGTITWLVLFGPAWALGALRAAS